MRSEAKWQVFLLFLGMVMIFILTLRATDRAKFQSECQKCGHKQTNVVMGIEP